MAEKTTWDTCRNGAIDAQKKAAAKLIITKLEKKISSEQLRPTTAQAPPPPSLYYPPKDTSSSPVNGSPPSIAKTDNAAHPHKPGPGGFLSQVHLAIRNKPPPTRPSSAPLPPPPPPPSKVRPAAPWRTQLTQSEHHSNQQSERNCEPPLTGSVRAFPLPPRSSPSVPLLVTSETKPKPRDHFPLHKSKSESPLVGPDSTQHPPQPNGVNLTHSQVSNPPSRTRISPPKADVTSNGYTKPVCTKVVCESTDGETFTRRAAPLRRRRSHSFSSDGDIRQAIGKANTLTPPPSPPKTREAPKSPSKRRLLSLFHRSSSDQVCLSVCLSVHQHATSIYLQCAYTLQSPVLQPIAGLLCSSWLEYTHAFVMCYWHVSGDARKC